MAFGLPLNKKIEVAASDHKSGRKSQAACPGKNFERFVHGIDFDYGDESSLQISADVWKQTGLAGFLVCSNRNVGDGQVFFPSADDGFHRISEIRNDIELQSRIFRVSAEATGGVRDLGSGKLTHGPAPGFLQKNF